MGRASDKTIARNKVEKNCVSPQYIALHEYCRCSKLLLLVVRILMTLHSHAACSQPESVQLCHYHDSHHLIWLCSLMFSFKGEL